MSFDLPFLPIALTEEQREANARDTRSLISELKQLDVDKPRKGRVTKFTTTIDGSDVQVNSWKFNEWDYSKKTLTLPTYARGLFTTDDAIVCRGYNKFYNMDETQDVSESNLRETTSGPYTLTLKSNGCIVFISGLQDGTLVVCSKHSTGHRDDTTRNHAEVAEDALKAQLADHGISSTQLATTLYNLGVTAVAELCDDRFEEHVLAYPVDKAGLYLHGLNLNVPKFTTYPMAEVNMFAHIFGFRETKFLTFDGFDESLQFMKQCAETGSWQGQAIEGFVVRCFRGEHDNFFFKYKFKEPYLLYREMREVTKQYLNGTNPQQIRYGKHKLVCMDYLKFAMVVLHDNPAIAEQYLNNKGIIELRDMYLESKGQTGLQAIDGEVSMAKLENEARVLEYGNKSCRYILVTVATIGCGKTTTALTVANLYPELIGHIQNDNIQRPVGHKLVNGALVILVDKPIVIIDKNDHKFAERQMIFDDLNTYNTLIPKSKLKVICLNFLPSGPRANKQLWKLTRSRVIDRGNNHQSIKAEGNVAKAEGIMKGFISRYQPVNPSRTPDSLFDLIINLDVITQDSSVINAKTIVDKLVEFAPDLQLQKPTDEQYAAAFAKALQYEPTLTKNMGSTKPRIPQYFGISVPPADILPRIDSLGVPFYEQLKQAGRIQEEFHVTMMHRGSSKRSADSKKLWTKYTKEVFSDDLKVIGVENATVRGHSFPIAARADVRLERFCSNDKLACVKVRVERIYREDGTTVEIELGNKFPHITLGTAPNVLAMESNNLLNDIYEFGATDGVTMVDLDGLLEGLPLYASYC